MNPGCHPDLNIRRLGACIVLCAGFSGELLATASPAQRKTAAGRTFEFFTTAYGLGRGPVLIVR